MHNTSWGENVANIFVSINLYDKHACVKFVFCIAAKFRLQNLVTLLILFEPWFVAAVKEVVTSVSILYKVQGSLLKYCVEL